MVSGENIFDRGADFTSGMKDLLWFDRINSSSLVCGLIYDSEIKLHIEIQLHNQLREGEKIENKLQVGVVVFQARDRDDLHLSRSQPNCSLSLETRRRNWKSQELNSESRQEKGFKKCFDLDPTASVDRTQVAPVVQFGRIILVGLVSFVFPSS